MVPATGQLLRVLREPALRLARDMLARPHRPQSEVPVLMRTCIERLSAESDVWTYIYTEERMWMTHDLGLPELKAALIELDPEFFPPARPPVVESAAERERHAKERSFYATELASAEVVTNRPAI